MIVRLCKVSSNCGFLVCRPRSTKPDPKLQMRVDAMQPGIRKGTMAQNARSTLGEGQATYANRENLSQLHLLLL